MDPDEALARLGAVATHGSLRRLVSARSLDRAVEAGIICRDARGRYSLPSAAEAHRAANALSGIVSHLSAAQHWGWELKTVPEHPHVTVPRNRRVDRARRRRIVVHWADLAVDDVRDTIVTSPSRTLIDCLTTCPLDEALAVADSALRNGAVSPAGLLALTGHLGGPGSGAARRVAALADDRAANPFESVLRAIALGVPALRLVPQQRITEAGFSARPDLVDADLRLVVEADSHTWHSSRGALRRDCRRYNALVLRGWTVLRFTWEDVMFNSQHVRDDLERFVEHAQHARFRRSRA